MRLKSLLWLQSNNNDTTMALSTLTTLLVLFAFVAAASCLPHLNITSYLPQIHFDSSLAAPCTKSRSKQGPECNFDWHNTSIWIGGVVPGPKNDILIDTQDKIFTLLCNGLCTGGGLNTTSKTLTIRMSENASVILDTWTATDLIFIVGGAFDATEVTVTALQISAYLSFERVTRSSIDSVDTSTFRTNQTTIEISSLTADGAYFYGSEVTVTDEFVTGTIWDAFDSELYFLGTCNSSEFLGNGQTFRDTYMQTTTACQYPLSQDALFVNTQWDIDMDSDSPSVYLLPDWIRLRLTEESAINLIAEIELRINTTIHVSDSYVEQDDDEASAVLLDNGYLSGHQGYFMALTALGGVIEASDDYFFMDGELHVGPKATIYIKDSGYLLTELLVLDQPTLNYSSAGSVRNFIEFNEGKLSGRFGTINLNGLPYVIEYDNTQGYIAAVSSNSPAAPPQVPPVASPRAPPVASTPINAPVAAPVTTTPVTVPVAPPQVLTPVSTPQSQVPVTNAPVFDTPHVSEPHAQPESESSPSSSNLSPTAVTGIFDQRTLSIVLAVGFVAAVIGLIVLAVLYRRAKRQGYQVINDPQYRT